MSFVVEDGTGLDTSNSYVSVSYADNYFEDRGVAAWAAATDDAKEQALVRATDYIDNRFTFLGNKNDEDQALEFPREPDSGDPELPIKLKRATCEYALRALTESLAPDPELDTGGIVIAKTETVGPITESTTYAGSGAIRITKPYPAADMLLRTLLASNRGVIRG